MSARLRMRAAALAAASMLLITTAAPAVGTDEPAPAQVVLSSSDLATLTDFFNQYAVPDATRTALIAKFEGGQIWDSLTDASPVSVQTVRKDGAVTTVSRYPDGSVSATTGPDLSANRVKPGGATTNNYGLYACPSSGNGTYRNCRVDRNDGLLRIYFYVDITYNAGTSGRIFNLWGCTPFSLTGTASEVSCLVDRSYATASPYSPAKAHGEFLYNGAGGVGTAIYRVYLYVFRGNAWTAI